MPMLSVFLQRVVRVPLQRLQTQITLSMWFTLPHNIYRNGETRVFLMKSHVV